MGQHLVRVLVLLVMLALPAAAVAAPKESAKTPKAPLVPQGPEQATVKIVRIGHLSGGKAQIFGTVPVVGSVTPFAPGQKVDVTFYLNGHKLLRRTVKVSSGKGDAGLFRASIVVRKDGKYAAAAHLRATDSTRGDATVRKSWRVSFPALGQGDCGRVVKGFKQPRAGCGHSSGGRPSLQAPPGLRVRAIREAHRMSRQAHA